MPEIDEIKYGREIDHSPETKYIWQVCETCGKQRWVQLTKGKPVSIICLRCNNIKRGLKHRGNNHFNWKGGRRVPQKGYIDILLRPDDFFYPMADCRGYVREHRLVMAKYVSRCLQSWEVVHHKNGVKKDNRIENLELLPARKYHLVDTTTKSLIKNLQKRITLLEAEITLLKASSINQLVV